MLHQLKYVSVLNIFSIKRLTSRHPVERKTVSYTLTIENISNRIRYRLYIQRLHLTNGEIIFKSIYFTSSYKYCVDNAKLALRLNVLVLVILFVYIHSARKHFWYLLLLVIPIFRLTDCV